MSQKINAVRGMHDCLPSEIGYWQMIEGHLRTLFSEYGYTEIRTPMMEETRLFTRSIGEVTDIVEKEMYTFPDQNDQISLSLRPEMTASIVRAGIQHGLFYNQVQKLWQIGPAFRYERPQKGRYRQFHQADVEVFGIETPDADAEMLAMLARFWKRLGIENEVKLEINSMGTTESRKVYREKLIAYFEQYQDILDEDCKRRLYTNPLRILDSKNPELNEVIAKAPKLLDYLEPESKAHFELLCQQLDILGIEYVVNPRIVRGMDYYTRTVFEWTTTKLGAQGTVCGGGRYDKMVEELGGRATPAIGFGMGMERLILLCQACDVMAPEYLPLVTTVFLGDRASLEGLRLTEEIRSALPAITILANLGGGSMKSQMKKADRSGAKYALIMGDNELDEGVIILKDLRENGEQKAIAHSDLISYLQNNLLS
ncbi:histidine--tRNA ligase [Ignatzschineria ureiclastica]|uniref:Histidine--tRNA ligase n=1 Tax=Ignatzschineria ureiclastica TaxID=472582 RepID=A0A2U2AEM0_9GAMM|nr:histidine--tRNA ligase [Ignatzschineria ureiclastica]PWD81077.1 histidine--tRNA ligase [Ignatzschineria ureiclastica]GGZ96050.1 histidine--tRNA ligase [Ignatzschineria ureiclastica]